MHPIGKTGKGTNTMEKNKINLLIVDDEEQFLDSIGRSLELRDFNVIAVNRGEKAIEAARKRARIAMATIISTRVKPERRAGRPIA